MIMVDIGKEVLRYPLHVLEWCGQNPEQNRLKYFAATVLYLVLGGISLILTILQFFYAHGDVITIAYNCEAFVAFGQTIRKCTISAIKVKNFHKMIENTGHFWSTNICTGELQEQLELTLRRTLKFEQLYFGMVVFLLIFVITASIFTKQLLTGVWTMTGYDTLYDYALILQEFVILWTATYTAGYDSLFLSFCVLLRTQYKILRYSLKDLNVADADNEKVYLNKLKLCIEHHKFLLRFTKDMRETYSPVMMVIYSSLILEYCAEMYILFESTSIFRLVKQSVVMAIVLVQLAFYCIPLNYVTNEAMLVSRGIYESDWYSKHVPALRTVIPFIIQRSQQEVIFKAGGMVVMNCRTILNVVRMSYSVCTIMRALKNA